MKVPTYTPSMQLRPDLRQDVDKREIEVVERLFRQTIAQAKAEAAIPESARPILHRISIHLTAASQANAQAQMIIGRASEYAASSAGRDLVHLARLWCDGARDAEGTIQ